MKQVNVNMTPRTKTLDMAVANIQMRVNMFKSAHEEELNKDEYNVDFNIAGRSFFRLPSEDEYFTFNVGSYKVDPRVSPTERAEFLVKYDNIGRRIKDIFILANDE